MFTPIQIAQSRRGDTFVLDLDHADVAQTFTFKSGSWGKYIADGTLAVTDAITPNYNTDGTSQAGSWTGGVTMYHLEDYSSAHIVWDGEAVTVDYSLDNGTTWVTISEYASVPLNPAVDKDFDIRVSFAGGMENDPAKLTSISVYVLRDGAILSTMGSRTLSFGVNAVTPAGLLVGSTTATLSPADTSAKPLGKTPVGEPDYTIGTIEMWVNPTTSAVYTGPAAAVYTNGVAGAPTPGALRHVVAVLNTAANTGITIGPNVTLTHLAVYPQRMTAQEVADLYATSVSGAPSITIHDASIITVTEADPALDIYAYAWSIVSG